MVINCWRWQWRWWHIDFSNLHITKKWENFDKWNTRGTERERDNNSTYRKFRHIASSVYQERKWKKVSKIKIPMHKYHHLSFSITLKVALYSRNRLLNKWREKRWKSIRCIHLNILWRLNINEWFIEHEKYTFCCDFENLWYVKTKKSQTDKRISFGSNII